MAYKNSPCKDCPERFIACSDRCPKDLRGEYGYKAWLADVHKQKAYEKEEKMRWLEDYRHSELGQAAKRKYVKSMINKKGGKKNGL